MLEIKTNKCPLNKEGILDGTSGELEVGDREAVQHAVRNLISQSVKLVNMWID